MPRRKLPDAEELRRLYWDESLTPREIAERYDASEHSVYTKMRRYGIPTRNKSEAMRLAHTKSSNLKKPRTITELRDNLRCRNCGWVWERTEDRIANNCPHCGAYKDARRRRRPEQLEKFKKWAATQPKSKKSSGRAGYAALRRSVLLRVGNGSIRCVRCGCDRPELLEINHKFGGGGQEYKKRGSGHFYWSIIKLERPVDDLELCCRVCNALHALELKYGPLPYKVIYEPSNGNDNGGSG